MFNWFHEPYIAVFTLKENFAYILKLIFFSWVVLRNMAGLWRSRYSSFFAWFGRISLELLISQVEIIYPLPTNFYMPSQDL